ncbi:MAG TPA: Ig-like domain-containing protein, partial [Verrucomicrobiota bacterium]|nr:Ig-like domain-containing protein [Verrucomicrobiota bacterium]
MCGFVGPVQVDQSDWPITNSDADAGGNYTTHRGFEIQGGVCYDPATVSWRYRVTALKWRGGINTSLNSGFVSTGPVIGVNVTADNYCEIITTMSGYLGSGRQAWHLRAASLAHEVHHRDVDWPGILNPLWANALAALQAESVSCERDIAEAEMILGAKVTQTLAALETAFTTALTTFNAGHDSARNDGAYQAGQNVLNARIQQIRDHAAAQGWPACPAAPAPAGIRRHHDHDVHLVGIEASAPRTILGAGQVVQLQVVGRYGDGTEVNLTAAPLTVYRSSDPAVATVNAAGQVTAIAAGAARITVSHAPRVDGHPLFTTVAITVPFAHDRDGDGMPDEWEIAHGLNPDDPRDAMLDSDGDGLRNLREFELGTNPRLVDTDGDGRSDFQETLDGTNPLVPDTRRRPFSLGLHYFALMNLETGLIEQRGVTGRNGEGHEALIMAPDTRYRQWVFHPATGRVGTADWITPASGRSFLLPAVIMRRDRSPDTDGDGLRDTAEMIVGTNPDNPDTDGDGISDGAEIRNGTNPLDGLPAATGVIASARTPGVAVDVAAHSGYGVVALAQAGVAIFNLETGFPPTLLALVDTPGNARSVALVTRPNSRDDLRVLVADGPAGLAVVDL